MSSISGISPSVSTYQATNVKSQSGSKESRANDGDSDDAGKSIGKVSSPTTTSALNTIPTFNATSVNKLG